MNLPQAPFRRPIRVGVLISGGGTTLRNFLDQREAARLDAEFPIVIASRPDCRGVALARDAGLEVAVIEREQFPGVVEFSAAVFDRLRDAGVDLVTLAGYLKLLEIPGDFSGRVLNIHPSLIPSFCGSRFYGHRVHEAVLARGVKVSGCTVHFADNAYDEGPIVAQRCVPVLDDDTPDTLAARVFEAECELYPEVIRLYAAGRLRIEGNRVRVAGT